MEILYEYRPDVMRSGPPKLVPQHDIEGKQGFVSIYGFDADCVEIIREHRGTWGLAGYPLYSDLLYIDIDKNAELIDEVKSKLEAMGVGFSLYSSGSPDSGHFHIQIVPMYGENIQYIQKQWVRDNFGDDVDLSIYKTSGIIRIAGSYHKKHAGHKKEKTYTFCDKILDLTGYETAVKIDMPTVRCNSENTDYSDLLDHMLMTRVYRNNRNNELFKRAAAARDAGYSLQQTINILQTFNETMVSPPSLPREVVSTVKSAYRGRY